MLMEAPLLPDFEALLPKKLRGIDVGQSLIPSVAKNAALMRQIDAVVASIPTKHLLHNSDSRSLPFLQSQSIHLVVTSPPYWTLKDYEADDGQLGYIESYEEFLQELDKVWRACYDALVLGGRLVCVVGDVLLSRRKNNGIHTCVPLH